MKYWFDTEFNEELDPPRLISIGIVCEDGREFYGELEPTYFYPGANDWVKKHVFPLLGHLHPEPIYTNKTTVVLNADVPTLKHKLVHWFGKDQDVELWAYICTYDFFLLCRLWKNFVEMPKNIPRTCRELKHFAEDTKFVKKPLAFQPEHHALVDARWGKYFYDKIKEEADVRTRKASGSSEASR